MFRHFKNIAISAFIVMVVGSVGWFVANQNILQVPSSDITHAAGDSCSDNIVEWGDGEMCDDGNLINDDGCSAGCMSECTVPADCPIGDPIGTCWYPFDTWYQFVIINSCSLGVCEKDRVDCVTERMLCNDSIDNDSDSNTDCEDSDCTSDALCGGVETGLCNNRIDDDNDGTVDCADSDCSSDPACGGGGGGGNNCELENICGDGQITGTEFCDNGGICTGSSNAAFEGRHCFDIDPTGYNIWGVQRCVATGGRCIPQNGDGCSSDCSEKCYTNNVPCMIDADCGTCGASCTNGLCIVAGSVATCEGSTEICNDGIDNDGDTFVDCIDHNCNNHSACGGANCGNASCDLPENCLNCAVDCGACSPGSCVKDPCPCISDADCGVDGLCEMFCADDCLKACTALHDITGPCEIDADCESYQVCKRNQCGTEGSPSSCGS